LAFLPLIEKTFAEHIALFIKKFTTFAVNRQGALLKILKTNLTLLKNVLV